MGALRDVPVIDDWVYASSVEHLLKTGELRVDEISAVYPVAQILWGALFAASMGFSFGALRLATLTMAAIGCLAFYKTLREVGVPPTYSFFGAAAVAMSPVYFALSFSFMTDVPFVSLSMIAVLFYVQAVRRDQPGPLWIAGAFAVLAFLVRPIGVVLPCAAATSIGWRRLRSPRAVAPVVVSLAAMAALWVVMGRAIGPLTAQADRFDQLRWWTMVTPAEYLTYNVGLLSQAVIPFLPLLLPPLAANGRIAMKVVAGAAVLGLLLWVTLSMIPDPLPDWQTWSLQDIGARAVVGGDGHVSAWSQRVKPIVRAVGLVAVAAFLSAAAFTARRGPRGAGPLLAIGLLHLAVINLLWMYNDRYYVALAPAIAFVASVWASERRTPPVLIGALLSLMAVVVVTGTRDMLDVNEACAEAARDLEASGVPPWEIDAGYPLNGWRLYAHPERLPPGADRRYDVPYVTSPADPRYRVTHGPQSGFAVVRVLPLMHAWWQATDRLYVLRRND